MSEFDLWGEIGTIYEDEAASAHRKVMELNRRFLNHWLRLGSLCEKKQKRQEAVQAYRRALELNGQNGRIWNELANVYFNAGAYEDAVEAYLKAIEMEPGYGWPYSNLGLAYTCLGRDGEAVPLHLKAVDLLTDAVERGMVWNRLGNAYRRVGDYENAAQAYRLADELAPGRVDLRIDLGEIHNDLANFDEDTDPQVSGPDEDAPVPQGGAPIHGGSGSAQPMGESPAPEAIDPQDEEALPEDTPPVEPGPAADHEPSAAELVDLSDEYLRSGNTDAAVIACQKAIALDPANGWAFSNLGLAHSRRGQYPLAVRLYGRALDLLTDTQLQAATWNRLGSACRRMNDVSGAREAYRRADELSPDTSRLFRRVRRSLLGNIDERHDSKSFSIPVQ